MLLLLYLLPFPLNLRTLYSWIFPACLAGVVRQRENKGFVMSDISGMHCPASVLL